MSQPAPPADAASKSKEDVEREQALEGLNHILDSTRPKNLREGVKSGVSNILAGCVGAAGIAVIAPTVGLTAGFQAGGLLGGIIGVTGGVVIGVVGAAAFAIGGAITGVRQILRGVAAVPEAVKAPRQGKWWSEVEGRWVYTDLPKEGATVKGVPSDDRDLLGSLQDDIDSSIRSGVTGEVVDMFYYDVLEVDPKVEPAAIKRRYYILARKYHPDKVGHDDIEAAEKFKAVAEAYQVLSDPELRARYDRVGRDGLSPDKTSVAEGMSPKLDPAILFAFLFGSDKFNDYIGRLATATSASIGDSPKLDMAHARELQLRRVTRLAVKLAEKLQPWVEGDHELCKTLWLTEAVELSTASYGLAFLCQQYIRWVQSSTPSFVYTVAAIQFLGSLDSGVGLPSVAKWAKSHHAALQKSAQATKSRMDNIEAGLDMLSLQAKFQKKLSQAKTDEERKAIEEELELAATATLLKVFWTTTVVDITSTIHEVAQMIFFDQSVDKETRKRRAQGLEVLGDIFAKCPDPPKVSEQEKDARQLYEEAAFAAMLETIKRKDEAAHEAATSTAN